MDGRAARARTLLALAGLLVVQTVVAVAWVQPGPLSIDEVLYQWMTRSAAQGTPLTVSNGYEELPSRELATANFMWGRDGKLTGQYPLLYPILASPLYKFLGFRALFLFNACAFAGVLVLTWHIGFRLLKDRIQALAACVILVGGTFAWDYSMAAWPHMLTLLFQLAAFYLLLTALDRSETPGLQWRPFLIGMLLGFAAGIRRDAFFFFPVVGLPLLFARPPRIRSLLALGLGAIPLLALIGWLNWLRWEIWSPLSYGNPTGGYRGLRIVGLLGLVGLAALSAPRVRAALTRNRRAVALLGVAAVGLLAVLPGTRPFLLRSLRGVESIFVDLGGFAPPTDEWPSGYQPALYVGGIKKSLLQSLPWLPVVLVVAYQAWRQESVRRSALLLALPVAIYVGIPVFLNRDGGMGISLRYVIPALPFLAILATWALKEVWASASTGSESRPGVPINAQRLPTGVLAAGTLLALILWTTVRPVGSQAAEFSVLAVILMPLALALLVSVAIMIWMSARQRRRASLVLLAATGAALTWSGALAYDYDARWSRGVRSHNYDSSRRVAAEIQSPALLFAELNDVYVSVPEFKDDVLVAFPYADSYTDFRRLTDYHLRAGRKVYAVLPEKDWRALEARGHLEGLFLSAVDDGPGLVRIHSAGADEG